MKYFGTVLLLFLLALQASSIFAASQPSLQILTPLNDEARSQDKVLVKFQLRDFRLVDFRKIDLPKQNEGHLHIWLDEKNPTATNAKKHISEEPYLLTNLAPGDHKLTVELVHSDHSSFAPKLAQTVNFKIIGSTLKTSPTPIPERAPVVTQRKTEIALGAVIAFFAVAGIGFLIFRLKK